MCCLFGYYRYGSKIEKISVLTNLLAENAAVRGTDAAGIAYNNNGKLVIHKEAKSASYIDFKHPDNAVCVTGHTRHATQGDKNKNYNNHPFSGSCRNIKFALSHNGVIVNDDELKAQYNLPKTRIETDSYIAVQLLEKKRNLNVDSVKFMSESLKGSFAFSILDSSNTLWLVRGDSPLSVVHLPEYKLYVYTSTDEILYKSLVDTKLFDEIKKGRFEELIIEPGDIIRIKPNGKIFKDKFKYSDYSCYQWWNYEISDNDYVENLKTAAAYQGYPPDMVDDLMNNGFSPEEIEDYIYCVE